MSALDITKWAESVKAKLPEASKAIKIELFSSVIADTRVRTGRLRGGWQTTTGSPTHADNDRLDPNGTESTDEVLGTVTADGVDYISNNVPYAPQWEEQDGMIAKNMARIQQIVKGVTK